jgi:hypothetical protein
MAAASIGQYARWVLLSAPRGVEFFKPSKTARTLMRSFQVMDWNPSAEAALRTAKIGMLLHFEKGRRNDTEP